MKLPKWIFFDYGLTLFDAINYGEVAGERAVLRHATRNPNNTSAEEIQALYNTLALELVGKDPDCCHEIVFFSLQRYIYEYFGLEFDKSPQELEAIFWENCSPGTPVPHIAEFLDLLWKKGIHTAVVSNLCFCEKTLRDRIEAGLPNHHFEFFISSAEYGFKKPSRRIYEIALKKAGISPEDAWFCGNDSVCDVQGSANAGLFPVWYKGALHGEVDPPRCKHLAIDDWNELIDLFQRET